LGFGVFIVVSHKTFVSGITIFENADSYQLRLVYHFFLFIGRGSFPVSTPPLTAPTVSVIRRVAIAKT